MLGRPACPFALRLLLESSGLLQPQFLDSVVLEVKNRCGNTPCCLSAASSLPQERTFIDEHRQARLGCYTLDSELSN